MFELSIIKAFSNHKDRPCLCVDNRIISYNEFKTYVSYVQSIISASRCSGTCIGIVMHNDITTYASIIASLLSGSAYFIINPDIPIARNDYIIKTAKADLILSSKHNHEIKDIASLKGVPFVTTEKTPECEESSELMLVERSSDDLAYILFTSGSTGVPKGVQISTGNLDAFVESYLQLGINMDDTDKVLQMFDLTFDVSVAMFVIPLLSGSCTYPVQSGDVKYMSAFKLAIRDELTVLCLVPSMLTYLRRYFDEINLCSVRLCILTAEASVYDIVSEWSRCIPNAQIWNLYGPTEATIWSLAYRWKPADSREYTYNSMIPIGKPLKNVNIAVVGADALNVNETNVKGELYLSGPQVSCGYLNDQTTTLRSFITDNDTGKIFYKTGDLVYYNENWDIQYCGRIDHQVQIQGYRVELSEIEHHSRQFSNSGNVVAIGWENQANVQTIVLFVEKANSETEVVIDHLKSVLPYYMIPSRIICLDVFPLNNSSKVDRKRLENQLNAL